MICRGSSRCAVPGCTCACRIAYRSICRCCEATLDERELQFLDRRAHNPQTHDAEFVRRVVRHMHSDGRDWFPAMEDIATELVRSLAKPKEIA